MVEAILILLVIGAAALLLMAFRGLHRQTDKKPDNRPTRPDERTTDRKVQELGR